MEDMTMKSEAPSAEERLARLKESMRKLNRIGAALSHERDLTRLLEMILDSARDLIGCDAASLYLVSPDETEKKLFFKVAQNESVSLPFKEVQLAMDETSIAGFVASRGEPLNIPNVREIPPSAPYSFNLDFDKRTGYTTVSMLTFPMENRQGRLLGVVQLINKKRDASRPLGSGFGPEAVEAFDPDSVDLAMSLGGQAAVAIENGRLLGEIEKLFDAFVKASVTAIESRDPTTSGHSERVAAYMTGLAETVTRTPNGPYGGTSFSPARVREIRYASLLHDFGKIGVREAVLVKAKKLYPHELTEIERRSELIGLEMKLHAANRMLESGASKSEKSEAVAGIEESLTCALDLLQRDIGAVRRANNPSVLESDVKGTIEELTKPRNGLPGYRSRPLIDEKEACRLTIPRGSLSEEERLEIESHVTRSYEYLCGIPWTQDLRRVPEIAFAHHEKLNGHGYPRGLAGAAIPVEARMLTICDIYDALTAWDRPYKKAVPLEKALGILQGEVDRGAVDADLFRLFVEAKVFDLVRPDKS